MTTEGLSKLIWENVRKNKSVFWECCYDDVNDNAEQVLLLRPCKSSLYLKIFTTSVDLIWK